MIFDDARALADAVLYEGYALYPYRPSSPKNQLRFQFGVLAPRVWSHAGGRDSADRDPWWLQAQTLLAVRGAPARIQGRLRFLQLQRRGGSGWDEGRLQEIDFELPVVPAADTHSLVEIRVDDGTAVDAVGLQRWPLAGAIRARATASPSEGREPLLQVTVRVENLGSGVDAGAPRNDALRGAFVGTHLLLAATGADFVSLIDPPEWAASAASRCRNVGTYPVLAGPARRRDLVLCAPLILGDHPAIAPESPQDLFDATEIDEILSLRVLTLTDGEKAEMRAAEPRLAALLDRVERMGPEGMERLHGATRDMRAVPSPSRAPSAAHDAPAPARIRVQGQWVSAGSRVRLQPGARRTDAQDMFLAGMTATVAEVMRDVEDQDCLAVTIDDDPATEVMRWHRRYHYFYPDEIEPLDAEPTG